MRTNSRRISRTTALAALLDQVLHALFLMVLLITQIIGGMRLAHMLHLFGTGVYRPNSVAVAKTALWIKAKTSLALFCHNTMNRSIC